MSECVRVSVLECESRKSHACHAKGAETKGRQRDARDVHHAPCRAESRTPATQKARRPRDARGTPEGRQRRTSRPLQSRKSHACHAKGAETKGRQKNARGTPETYITPLATSLASLWRPSGVPWSPRLLRGRRAAFCSARGVMYVSGVPLAFFWRPLVSAPFAWQACDFLLCKGRDVSRKPHACHAKGAETKGAE